MLQDGYLRSSGSNAQEMACGMADSKQGFYFGKIRSGTHENGIG